MVPCKQSCRSKIKIEGDSAHRVDKWLYYMYILMSEDCILVRIIVMCSWIENRTSLPLNRLD